MVELMLLISLLILYINYRERNLKRRALILEHQVSEKTHQILEQRKEVDELKSRFYTNISHEFRTPLTLLMGPLEDSMKKPGREVSMGKGPLRIMLRNARRLQQLINQLLDISKLESGKMLFQPGRGNLGEFVRTISGTFLSLAESRRIVFIIDVGQTIGDTYFDSDKTEKVITNLLSNAFKFTPEGGTVSIRLTCMEESGSTPRMESVLEVADSGKGIGKEHLDRIFERFYQVSDPDTAKEAGTGIGLALTREMVELMHGEISVESKPGEGTKFTVRFPVSEESFTADEIQLSRIDRSPEKGNAINDLYQPIENVADAYQKEKDCEKSLILIVEDHPDLRNYIREQLVQIYRVAEAKNGEEGFESALKLIPDLVITDLMMPVMGGIEMCEKLKNHPATNHIPVIMLTARADLNSKLKGLETGADDYIIKPFDTEELRVRANNLIMQRMRLKETFRMKFATVKEDMEAPIEDLLMQQLLGTIDRHLENPEFTIDHLVSQLNMSRTQVFRKVSALTGYTPKELIRSVRLKKAAGYFRNGHKHVAQVMHRVGFNNQSYFSKCFRDLFGMNPSEYIRSGKS